MTLDELAERLKSVPQSYPEFVRGLIGDAIEFGTADDIARFIDENPDAGAGRVTEYSMKIAGII